jgi:TonB family protein
MQALLHDHSPRFLDESPENVGRHPLRAGFAPRLWSGLGESPADPLSNPPSGLRAIEISGFQVAAMVAFALLSLAAGLAVGRGDLAKRLLALQRSSPEVNLQPPVLRNRPAESSPQTSDPPAASNLPVPEASPPVPRTAGSPVRPEVPATHAGPVPASPQGAASNDLVARIAPPPAPSYPAPFTDSLSSLNGASPNPASRKIAPAPAPHVASRPPLPAAVLVSGPGDGSRPFRLTLPEKPIAASSSFAMASQLSVLVPPAPGGAFDHRPARVQAGRLLSFVWPRYPRPGERHGAAETVKIRTTIGEHGQVLDVKQVSGSASLFSAAVSAIRQWRYQPTFVNSRPVPAQQDVTIEFRPSQHLSSEPVRQASRSGR